MSTIDNPVLNDNRDYNYSEYENFQRDDYKFIVDLIESNSRVIDLGCGNGALMQMMKKV